LPIEGLVNSCKTGKCQIKMQWISYIHCRITEWRCSKITLQYLV